VKNKKEEEKKETEVKLKSRKLPMKFQLSKDKRGKGPSENLLTPIPVSQRKKRRSRVTERDVTLPLLRARLDD